MPVETQRKASWALALTATSTMAVSYVDRQTLSVLAPTVTKALDLSSTQYGYLISAFAVAYLVGAPIAGRLLDTVGARKGLLGAVLVWSAIAAAHALVPNLAALFALRIALGLAEAPSFPGAAQTVQRALPPEHRGTGFGILFTGSSFGAMVAPPLATWLEHRYDFRIAFLGTALVGLAWVPLWLTVAFSAKGRAVMDAPFEGPKAASGDWMATLTSAPVLRLIVVIVTSAPFLSLMLAWGAKYLVSDHHLEQHQVGTYLIVPPLLFDLGSVGFGYAASRLGRSRGGTVPRALIALAGALAAVGAFTPFVGNVWGAVVVASIGMGGGAAIYALVTVDTLSRVPGDRVSTVGGISAAAQSLAHIVVNPLIGKSVDILGNYKLVFLVLGLWVLPGIAVWLLWTPKAPAPAPGAHPAVFD